MFKKASILLFLFLWLGAALSWGNAVPPVSSTPILSTQNILNSAQATPIAGYASCLLSVRQENWRNESYIPPDSLFTTCPNEYPPGQYWPSWIRLQIYNPLNTQSLITIQPQFPWIDSLNIQQYDQKDSLLFNSSVWELDMHFQRQPHMLHLATWKLKIPAGDTSTIYIRARDEIPVPLLIHASSEKQATKDNLARSIFYGFYYGILLFILAYNITLYIKMRQAVYLFYSIYIFIYAIFSLALVGLLQHFYWLIGFTDVYWVNRLTYILTAFLSIFLTLFVYSYLNINRYPRLNKVKWLSIGSLTTLAVFSASTPPSPLFPFVYAMLILGVLLTYTQLLGLGVWQAYKKNPNSYYFLISFVWAYTGVYQAAIVSIRITEPTPNAYVWLLLGSLLENIMLTFALSEHVRRTHNDSIEKKREQVKTAEKLIQYDKHLQHYMPQKFLDLLKAEKIISLAPGYSVKCNMSILVVDIRNFTPMAEKVGGYSVMNYLNEYLEHIELSLRRQGGFIHKFIGDAVVILFDDADKALTAILDIQDNLHQWNIEREAEGKYSIEISSGISSGLITLGVIGNKNSMMPLATGSPIQRSLELQTRSKRYRMNNFQNPVMIDSNTIQRLKSPSAYSIEKVEQESYLCKGARHAQ